MGGGATASTDGFSRIRVWSWQKALVGKTKPPERAARRALALVSLDFAHFVRDGMTEVASFV